MIILEAVNYGAVELYWVILSCVPTIYSIYKRLYE